ncbi:hypothetical protein [Allokutzneria oryzae]|uniref:Uncharacterized protein n=1 Tax=Allokutzneria oryzae TaxID=1378989 RepID=A0ABV6A7G4_9PSEU
MAQQTGPPRKELATELSHEEENYFFIRRGLAGRRHFKAFDNESRVLSFASNRRPRRAMSFRVAPHCGFGGKTRQIAATFSRGVLGTAIRQRNAEPRIITPLPAPVDH